MSLFPTIISHPLCLVSEDFKLKANAFSCFLICAEVFHLPDAALQESSSQFCTAVSYYYAKLFFTEKRVETEGPSTLIIRKASGFAANSVKTKSAWLSLPQHVVMLLRRSTD